MNTDKIMGGISLLLSGDFRQILPVVKKGNIANHINACLKTSYLWDIIKTIRLKENMRVKLDSVIENDSFP